MSGEQDLDLNYTITQKTRPSLNGLETFLSKQNFETQLKSPYSNIIDQLKGRTFCIPITKNNLSPKNLYSSGNYFIESSRKEPISAIGTFFDHLEECRLDGLNLCFSEKQYFTIQYVENRQTSDIEVPDIETSDIETSDSETSDDDDLDDDIDPEVKFLNTKYAEMLEDNTIYGYTG